MSKSTKEDPRLTIGKIPVTWEEGETYIIDTKITVSADLLKEGEESITFLDLITRAGWKPKQ